MPSGAGMLLAFRRREELRFGREDYFCSDRMKLGKLLRVGIPVTATSAVSCSGYIVFAGMGLTAVWWCMIADNVCKAVLLTVVGLRQGEGAGG